ncbi:MAG: nucleotidyltransferase family protein [Pseudomonadota bacterium]
MTQPLISTAIVLAAGLGTRMRPLTDAVPKPLVRLRDRPLIDHVLDRIAAAGLTTAIVNVHFKADMIESHVRARTTPAIQISDERDQLLDTGGGVKRALQLANGDPVLVHNSDSTWIEGMGSNIERMLMTWDPSKMDCLLLLALGAQSLGYDGRGDFLMAPDGRVSRRRERDVAPFAFTGVSIAHPRLLDDTPDGPFSLNLVWDRAIQTGRLYGVRLDGKWMHVGTPDALRDAEAWIDQPHDT